ncbi:PaaI family thioesterase [Nocardia otitidiscaviarum]|uniref:PaaI family thioesterase n=1 Tax=Nocardia otitidiscaviarum TaxID=1823 RepID=UPI0018939004|nr:PaaI family thioesterase [Nocardia otitidiscaviarum]MBF6181921.1 PaaI family thioesterase [Nocardia otitidiscaviarum]
MSDDTTVTGHDEIMKHALALFDHLPVPPGVELKLPPPSTTTLEMRFAEFVPGKSLSATVTVAAKYGNVMGLLQGGFLAAMFDDLMAPLGYLTARNPTTSMELTTHFLRPVFVGEQLTLTATVRKRGQSVMYIAAEAVNANGKLVATAMSTIQVMPLSK